MTEWENTVVRLLTRIANAFPEEGDIRFFTGDSDTVAATTILTITFTLRRDYRIIVTELYADVRADCTYEWQYSGEIIDFNEASYPYGKLNREDVDKIVLKITNIGVSQTIGYYVKGWARKEKIG